LSGSTRSVSTWQGTYDNNRELIALTIDVGFGSSNVTFDKRLGDTLGLITNGPLSGLASIAIKANGTALGIAAEPAPIGWKYQSYGVWVTGITGTSGTLGAASIGNRTAAAKLPGTGKAIFSGNAGGFYIDPQGVPYITAADMVAVADFGTRSITISTLNTSRSSNFQTFVASPQLDISGRATIFSQNSIDQFLGFIASRNGMTGDVSGSFYGPTASEIGGVYAVRGTGVESMIGGFGGSSDPIVSFTSWQTIPLNTVVQAQGISTQAGYTGTSSTTTSISSFTTSSRPATYNSVYDNNGDASLVLLQSGEEYPTNVVFNKVMGDTIAVANVGPAAGVVSFAERADGTALALAAEPLPQGWDYQSFGVWVTGYAQAGGGTFGALSVGSQTAAASIPASGVFTYSGSSGGIYTNTAGNPSFTVADMSASVNFASRQINFSTSNTNVVSNNFTTFTPNNQLDMNGTLQITSGENRFFGAVNTNAMTGSATGQFYGPSASEIGGTYGVKGAGLESMVGAFGGKR
jgi:hypothetical protein